MKRRKTPRSKAARKTSLNKTVTKSPQRQNVLAITAEIEKEFFSLPAKLVALCRREQALIKQGEAKLKTTLKAATTKHQVATKRLSTLRKGKKPATKKQLNDTRKLITTYTRLVAQINRDIKLNKSTFDGVAKKQAGFAFLAKDLPKLRKQMLTAARKTIKKPATRKKRGAQQTRTTANKFYDGSHQTIPVISTRVDTTEIT